MKMRIWAMSLLAVCLLSFSACAAAPQRAGRSPEETIRAYVQAAAERDRDAMASCFAMEEAVAGYDPETLEAILRTPVAQPLTAEQRQEDILSEIERFAIGFLDQKPLDTGASREELLETIQNLDWEALSIVHLDAWDGEAYDLTKDILEDRKAVYGAQDAAEYTALLEMDGRTYFFSAQLLQYGEEWKLWSTGDTISKTVQEEPSFDVVIPMEEGEYFALTER